MNTRIIGLTGKMRAGKDTVADHLVSFGYQRHSFAGAIKDEALIQNPAVVVDGHSVRLARLVEHVGWDAAKRSPEVRRVLQDVGRAGRNIRPTFWVDQVERSLREPGHHVVTDVRMPNEAHMVLSHGGVILRVVRPGHVDDVSHSDDITETALDGYDFVTLWNTGTVDDLHEAINVTLARMKTTP